MGKKKEDINNQKNVRQSKPVKKSHGCRNCFITALVVVIVFCGVLVGGAFFAWGKYVEPQINLTLGEALKIAGGLLKNSDESKVVSNPYTQADLDNFYTQFKTKLYIKESVNINIGDILASAIPEGSADDTAGENNEYSATIMENNNPEVESSGTGSPVLDKLLADLEFDFSSLSSYTGAPNILEITDKSLAALLNEALTSVNIQGVSEQLSSLGVSSISEIAQIKQVIIAGQNEDVSLKITIEIKLKDTIKNVVENNEQLASAKKFIKLLYPIIPKSIYAGVTVFPNDATKQAQISLNEIDDALIAKAITGINNITNAVSDVLTTVNTTVISTLDKVETYMPINFVESGSIQTQPISAMMTMLKVGGTISEAQFLYMIRDISLPTAESLGYAGYNDEYRDSAVNSLIKEMTVDYGIDNSDNFLTKDNLITVLPTLVSDENNIKRIDLSRLNYNGSYQDIKTQAQVNAAYAAVAGLVNSYIANNPEAISLDVSALNLTYKLNAKNEGELTVLASVNINSVLPANLTNGTFGKIIASVLPQNIFAEITINMTNAEATSSFTMNGLNQADTEDRMNTIKALASAFGADVSALETTALIANVDKAIRDGLGNITKSVGEIVYTQDGIIIPDIYSVISRQEQLKPTSEDPVVVSDEDVYGIFKATYTYLPDDSLINVTSTTTAVKFADEVEDKYFLYDKLHNNVGEVVMDKTTGQKLETIDGTDGLKLITSLKDLSTTYENSLEMKRLTSDTRPLDELTPVMSQEEFGFIVKTSTDLNAAITFLKNTDLISSRIIQENVDNSLVDSYIEIIVTGELNITNAGIYGSLMPKRVYINIRIDTEKLKAGDNTCLDFTIDNMSEQELNKFLVVAKRMGNVTVNKDEIKTQTADKFIATTKDLGATVEYEFGDGKLTLTSTVFDVAKNKLYATEIAVNKDPETTEQLWVPTAEQMRTTLVKANTTSTLQTNNVANEGQQAVAFNSQVNNKYYLLDNYKLPTEVVGDDAQASTNIVNRLKDLSTNYKSAIDGAAMAKDTRELGELNPMMKGSEFGYIVDSQVDIKSTISNVKEGKVNSSYIKSVGGVPIAVLVFDISFQTVSKLIPQVINVVVEINMDSLEYTTEFTINDIAKTSENGEKSELEVAINIMNKTNNNSLSIETINEQLNTNVKNAMNSLTASAKISFHGSDEIFSDSGKASLDNIYEVAVNSLYKDDIAHNETVTSESEKRWIPQNDELRRVITNLHTESGLAKNNINTANNANGFIDDLNDKYYLSTPIVVNGGEKILDKVKTIGADYQSIDGKAMAADQRAYSQLNPTMTGGEFGYIVNQSFVLTDIITGLKDTSLDSSYIVKPNTENYIQMIFKGSLVEADNNTLLPKTMDIISFVNTASGYATTFTINSLSNDANGEYSDLELAVRVLNKFSTEEKKMSIEEINTQLTTKMNSYMTDIANNAQMTFNGIHQIVDNGESGEVILGTVFDVAVGNIYNQDEEKPSGEVMRDTLKALHTPVNTITELIPDGGTTSITPSVSTGSGTLDLSAEITDMQIGEIVKNQNGATNSMYSNLGLSAEGALTFTQSALLLASDNSDRAQLLRNNYGSDILNATSDYIVLAMNVKSSALTNKDLSLMPEYITLTMIMDLSTKEGDTNIYSTVAMYNLLSNDQVSILRTIVERNNEGGSTTALNANIAETMRTTLLNTVIISYDRYVYTVQEVLEESARVTITADKGLGKFTFNKIITLAG